MSRTSTIRNFQASLTPTHKGRCGEGYEARPDDALVMDALPSLGLGERCRWREGITPTSEASSNQSPLVWHAAITNPNCERQVRRQLQDRGIDTVLPMVRYWQIRNRQRSVAERPLIARCVLFGYDPKTQSLQEPEERYERVGETLVRVDAPSGVRPILGLERIVRGASDEWAVLPTSEIYDLRYSILKGDFDATLREGKGNVTRDLPPIIKWLVKRGELKREAILTHNQAKLAGLKFSVAA